MAERQNPVLKMEKVKLHFICKEGKYYAYLSNPATKVTRIHGQAGYAASQPGQPIEILNKNK